MTVRAITSEESGTFLEHLERLIRETISLPPEAIDHFVKQWTPESINEQLERWAFIIAEDGDSRIAGLILGTPPEGGVATIIWVLVDPSVQRKGVGGQLFRAACAFYKERGAHKIKLTVPDKETVAFYEKQGMNLEGVHPDHWWNHDFWSMGILLNL